MNELTFSELCDAFDATLRRIALLETLPQGMFEEDYEGELEDLLARRTALREALVRYPEEASGADGAVG